jgi:hypothetical protein
VIRSVEISPAAAAAAAGPADLLASLSRRWLASRRAAYSFIQSFIAIFVYSSI